MLQRTDTKLPKAQLTPQQMLMLNAMLRVAAPGAYGPKMPRGFPKNFRPVWFGQFVDVKTKRRRGTYAAGTARTELGTYKSPVIVMVDTRPKEHRPPFNKAREMSRRVFQRDGVKS